MEYKIIFEISKISMGLLGFLLAGTFFIIIGITLIKFQRHTNYAPFGYIFFTFALLWTIISTSSIYSKHSSLRKNYITNNYKIVEGTIENLTHTNRDKVEIFTVKGISFKYSYGVITSGFNHTNKFGGPIREGLKVRISYVENTIIKIEVKRP
jgi:hypothetical protein